MIKFTILLIAVTLLSRPVNLFPMPQVEKWAAIYEVPPRVIRAMVFVESNDNPYVVGALGERGFLQILPGTAEYIASCTGMSARRILNDPKVNIRAGTWYFSIWYHRFREEGREDPLEKALAAYNGGPAWVLECDCVPEFTEHYVWKVKETLGWNLPDEICVDNSGRCLVEDKG